MNKYEEAFHNLCGGDYSYEKWLDSASIINELVEKATPKKPIQLENKDRHKCPSCGSQLPFKKNALKKKIICCNKCTQMIDWSE